VPHPVAQPAGSASASCWGDCAAHLPKYLDRSTYAILISNAFTELCCSVSHLRTGHCGMDRLGEPVDGKVPTRYRPWTNSHFVNTMCPEWLIAEEGQDNCRNPSA